MTEYLIAFNAEWVPDHTSEELSGKASAARAVVEDMKVARLWAGRIAVACAWPQEVRPFMVPGRQPATP